MQLDVRVPIGLMFGILGAVLAIYGLSTVSDAATYERSLGININLWWGLLFIAFAATMLLLARKSGRKGELPSPAAEESTGEKAPPGH